MEDAQQQEGNDTDDEGVYDHADEIAAERAITEIEIFVKAFFCLFGVDCRYELVGLRF